jgi:hypothetical protein
MSTNASAPRVKRLADGRQVYEPDGEVLSNFLLDRSPVSVIQGPVGSGKSKGSNMKVYAISHEQAPGPDGVRRTRWAVVRNTYPELKQTTIRTWLDTFPESLFGRFRWSVPYRQVISLPGVWIEVDFLALDKPEDVKKLRSGEYTGFYVNELQYIPKELFDEMTSRAGRYPAVKDGGCTWSGVIADMNAPEEDHWTAIMTGQVELPQGLTDEELRSMQWPEEWKFFMQPAGLLEIAGQEGDVLGYEPNPKAENVKWLKPNYYMEMVRGKTRSWVSSRILNVITVEISGNPVWRAFSEERHVAKQVLRPIPGHDIYVGLDFGRQPAMVAGQHINGRVVVLDELQGHDEGASVFAPKVKARLAQKFPGYTVRFFGDPKGQDKTQSDERTAYEVWASFGMRVAPAPVKMNQIKTRLEAVEFCLTQLVEGVTKFLLSPMCRTLKMAMKGKYHFGKNDENKVEPVKDRWSNIADALQYMILGMGEGRAMVGLTLASGSSLVARVNRSRGAQRRVH